MLVRNQNKMCLAKWVTSTIERFEKCKTYIEGYLILYQAFQALIRGEVPLEDLTQVIKTPVIFGSDGKYYTIEEFKDNKDLSIDVAKYAQTLNDYIISCKLMNRKWLLGRCRVFGDDANFTLPHLPLGWEKHFYLQDIKNLWKMDYDEFNEKIISRYLPRAKSFTYRLTPMPMPSLQEFVMIDIIVKGKNTSELA